MDKKRKFRIWLISLSMVFLVFLGYNFLIDTPEIVVDRYSGTGDDIEVPIFKDQEGDTKVGKVEKAMFRVLDEKTKELTHVYGFEELLNPGQGGGMWKMTEPYMYIYDDKFNCEITSRRGEVTVEEVAGRHSPTEAILREDVLIRIIPKKEGQSEVLIKLDTLVYNSERSEYSTDESVEVTSEDGVLEGKGMLLIYNNELARIEYLEVKDLDYILVTDASSLDREGDDSPVGKIESSAVEGKPDVEVPSEQLSTVEAGTTSEDTAGASEYYKCNLNKDVAIRYGDELVVTSQNEIVISNILWSDKSEKSTSQDPSVTDGSGDGVEVEAKTAGRQGDVVRQNAPAYSKDAESKTKSGVEVLVKCSGGLVIRPMDSLITPETANVISASTLDDSLLNILAKYEDTDWGIERVENPPATFGCKSVEYDMQTGGAVANAPVELKLYPTQTEAEDDSGSIPSVITANENTEFFANEDRRINKIVFNGDVVGSQEELTPLYTQTSSFHGQKLVVDLYETGGSGVEHVSVQDGKVKLEMERVAGGEIINHVRLKCKRIDYSMVDDIITSVGPGKIEINNENAPYVRESKDSKGAKSGSLSLKKPCYALIEGFDRLKWLPQDNRITADGKENSVNMSYLPIVDGKIGQVVRSSTTHVQADFVETVTGRNELAKLNAWGGVYYKEQAGNEFSGDKMTYDVGASMMVVTGTEGRDCLANGAPVPRIEYDLASGKIETRLSSSPGVISMPKKKKEK